ncbi:P-loop NTPase fold protein [Flavobacterium sp. KBS0721]|uniref:P-loop NTPase fold protein n=1 Tax=Flavobacterium sp. KBS0721 TaxID=1179672 RepID=UPI00098FDD39|nr:P-loop NTPase fold protein [Flavobacterium sp. KBS0721]QDW19007.1 hypothetical protein B0M43_0002435 [Flavobacterium sp. KBS0721]
MDSSHIKVIFEDYLKTVNSNYALLINGSWGSGKTYFWKDSLCKICSENNYKTLYISLNGLSKIETLDYQLKIKLIPLLNKLDSKKAISLLNLLKNIGGKIIQSKYNVSPEEILKDVEVDTALFSKQVICFDDLERCNIPLSEVLGYINNFVEHKNSKVLILSDESKIQKEENKNDTTYNSIKEKVIGRILNFNNDLNLIFPFFINKYEKSEPEFSYLLDQNKSFILEILAEFKEENLRNLSFYLESLNKLYPVFKSNIEFKKEIILFVLIITLEFKRGNLNSNDYKNFNDFDLLNPSYVMFNFDPSFSLLSKKAEKTPIEESELEKFYKRYLTNYIQDYFFYPAVYQFILTGYLDIEKFTNELKSRIPIEPTIENATFTNVATNKFRQLSNEEFNQNIERFLVFAKQGKYDVPDYLQISKFLNFYSENSIIDQTKDEIRKILLEGLHIAKENIIPVSRMRNFSFDMDQNPTDDTILRDKIIEYINASQKEFEKEKSNSLLIAIAENDLEQMKDIFDGYNVNKELFLNFSAEILWAHLQNSENKTITQFTNLLKQRHSFSNIKSYFLDNAVLFKDLILCIKNSESTGNLQDMLKKELIVQLEEICERMK